MQRAIDSVTAQSFRDWELLIVDDASPAPLPANLESGDFPGIRIVRHDRNKGAAGARNPGIRDSRGQWLAFLDSDDARHPAKLEVQLAAMDGVPSAPAASVTGFDIYRAGRDRPENFTSTLTISGPDDLAEGCRVSPGSTLMARRSLFDKIGYFDEDLKRLEDWDWLIRLSQEHEILPVADPLADIHVSHATGRQNLAAVLTATDVLRDRYLALMSDSGGRRRRQFLSTLLIEDATAYHWAGHNLKAALVTMRAISVLRRHFKRVFGWNSGKT